MAGFCVIQAVTATQRAEHSARAKPRGEGFRTATDLESDTVAPSGVRVKDVAELSELAGAQNFSVDARNQSAPRVYAPQQRGHNFMSAQIQAATFGTKVPETCQSRLRELRRCALNALISPLFCASTARNSVALRRRQPHARNADIHQQRLGAIGAHAEIHFHRRGAIARHIGGDDEIAAARVRATTSHAGSVRHSARNRIDRPTAHDPDRRRHRHRDRPATRRAA